MSTRHTKLYSYPHQISLSTNIIYGQKLYENWENELRMWGIWKRDLNQSHMVAGWAPTMRGPRATGNRLETTCSTGKISHFSSRNDRFSSCYAISPGWAYTATRAIEAVHSWCFLWMCLYILKIGKNITVELKNRRKREWKKLMWKHDYLKNCHCLLRKRSVSGNQTNLLWWRSQCE